MNPWNSIAAEKDVSWAWTWRLQSQVSDRQLYYSCGFWNQVVSSCPGLQARRIITRNELKWNMSPNCCIITALTTLAKGWWRCKWALAVCRFVCCFIGFGILKHDFFFSLASAWSKDLSTHGITFSLEKARLFLRSLVKSTKSLPSSMRKHGSFFVSHSIHKLFQQSKKIFLLPCFIFLDWARRIRDGLMESCTCCRSGTPPPTWADPLC